MRMNFLPKSLLIFILLFSFQSVSAEPFNITLLKKELVAYHDSGTYERDFATVVHHAQDYIQKRVNENKRLVHPQKLALVLDIDETSLSNYSAIIKHDFAVDRSIIHRRILAAKAPALQATLQLYNFARLNGVSVFFVTGRPQNECLASQRNLQKVGFTHWVALYCRPLQDHAFSIIPFKSAARKKITDQGYDIIANIGDQNSDLKGGFAERGYKLPNPYYYLP
jgi:predicted secreted acid phosphatase